MTLKGWAFDLCQKPQLDEILGPAECTIVESLSNDHVDSYVLSESSLFVYPYKIIIKTCGTTKLLLSIPAILKLADTISLNVRSVRYTRGSFIFPGAQSYPHRSFSEEVAILDGYFGKLGLGSKAYIMGGLDEPQKWHVYSASADSALIRDLVHTIEMCMTGLDREKASVFYKTQSSSAAAMTDDSGIRKILPASNIFMQALKLQGYDLIKDVSLGQLVDRVLACFQPREFSIAVHADVAGERLERICSLDVKGYCRGGRSHGELGTGGSVIYQKFVRSGNAESPRSILRYCWKEEEDY
ncbi:S-ADENOSYLMETHIONINE DECARBOXYLASE [Salix viminalis]|uniref:adenosylmethionine decarboxylase n=1 Tax=Salix viminalis TaxID=40686 RepID=A0A9Q0Z4E9_SALVM|nr:S-ADENOSYLMETHIONINE DECARBOXYLASE [Salix viminalis]